MKIFLNKERAPRILRISLRCACVIFCMLLAKPLAAQDEQTILSNIKGVSFHSTGEFPVKGRLIFSLTIQDRSRICIFDLDGRKVRTLIESTGSDFSPALSPDGTKIAFVSNRTGNNEIFLADWNGTNIQQITSNSVSDEAPAWSPDGTTLVYTSQTGGSKTSPETNLFTVQPQKTPIRATQLTGLKGRNSSPRWSPSGNYIALSTNRTWPGTDVCLVNLVSRRESCPLAGKSNFSRPSWSSDGKDLFYVEGILEDSTIGSFNLERLIPSKLLSVRGQVLDISACPVENCILFSWDSKRRNLFSIHSLILGEKKSEVLLEASESIRSPQWSAVTTFELEAKRLKELQMRE